MKRLVFVDEQEFSLPSVVLTPQEFEYRTPFLTQVITKDLRYGSVPRRGASLRAKQVRNPEVQISIVPLTAGVPDYTLLSSMSLRSSILSVDVFGNLVDQPDNYNVNASLLSATKGRLTFDVGSYPTGAVQLLITNRQSRNFRLKIQCAVFENT